MAIEIEPFVVASLDLEAQLAFSQPFTHDWSAIRAAGMAGGGEVIDLTDKLGEYNFGLPETYLQFIPVISLAVSHERLVRGSSELYAARLRIRQNHVNKNESQQKYGENSAAHQDCRSHPERSYSIANIQPTHFYPDIPIDAATNPQSSSVPIRPGERLVAFRPYDAVHASGLTYHRSPPMDEAGLRTFLHLAFRYIQ